jgi:hypothetical protein
LFLGDFEEEVDGEIGIEPVFFVVAHKGRVV